MSGPINISSTSQWQSLLSSTNVVVADFYADWCGPCKTIAPHYERLSKEHSSPKKVAFAKINVESQSAISQSLGVRAMPTFMIFHGGNCIETIKGANPSALTQAVTKAIKLGGAGRPGDVFKSPGRALGGDGPVRGGSTGRAMSWDINNLINTLVTLVGLYLVSLFTLDPYKSAEQSQFNVHSPSPPPSQARSSGSRHTGGRVPAPPTMRPTFKTLSDLGSE